MDYCRNVTVSGGLSSGFQTEQVLSPSCSQLGSSLDDLFSCHATENDVALEWLSMFMEDCLTSPGNCVPSVTIPKSLENKATDPSSPKVLACSKPFNQERVQQDMTYSLQKFVIPGKARSKIKRGTRAAGAKSKTLFTSWSLSQSHQYVSVKNNPYDPCLQMASSDPPLLQQTHWLADSELILPGKETSITRNVEKEEEIVKEENKMVMEEERMRGKEIRPSGLEVGLGGEGLGQQQQQQPRRCTHCLSQRTPQWRGGPLGPKTLCNACGVRYKSGRLLPEYRPAKSPTFVSYKHSNSHKKVMEMRMALMSSNS